MNAIIQGIARGAPMYNSGDKAGCAALYESIARALLSEPTIPDFHRALYGQVLATTSPNPDARAWAFRNVFDKTLGDMQFEPVFEAPLAEGFPVPGKVGVIERKAYPRCRSATGANFGVLFRHISRKGIAMTVPVISHRSSPGMSFIYLNPTIGSMGLEQDNVVVSDSLPLQVLSIGLRGDIGGGGMAIASSLLEEALIKYGAQKGGEFRVLSYHSPMVPQDRRYLELQLPLSS